MSRSTFVWSFLPAHTLSFASHNRYDVRVVSIMASGCSRDSFASNDAQFLKNEYLFNSLDIASFPSLSLQSIFLRKTIHVIGSSQPIQMIRVHFGDVARLQLPRALSLTQPNVPQRQLVVRKVVVSAYDASPFLLRIQKRLLTEKPRIALGKPLGHRLHFIHEFLLNLPLIRSHLFLLPMPP